MAMAEIKLPIQVNLPDDWVEQIVDRLRNDPEAEWVEIVRCKDCKYASPNGVYGCRLERFSAHDEATRLFADDYCSKAERRTDETDRC